MGTSFPSSRDLASILIYRESIRFGCVPAPATTQPAEESPPPLSKRATLPASASGDRRIGKAPLAARSTTSATFIFLSLPTRCASRTKSARAAPRSLHVFRNGPLGRGAWQRRCAGPFFKSFDQLPVARCDPECHPLRSPARFICWQSCVKLACPTTPVAARSLSTPRSVSSSFADRALSGCRVRDLFRILRRPRSPSSPILPNQTHLFTKRLHPRFESWQIDSIHTIVLHVSFVPVWPFPFWGFVSPGLRFGSAQSGNRGLDSGCFRSSRSTQLPPRS